MTDKETISWWEIVCQDLKIVLTEIVIGDNVPSMISGRRLSVDEVAERLGISIVRVRVLIRTGRLPAEKFGSAYAVRETDLKLVAHRPPGRPRKAIKTRRAA